MFESIIILVIIIILEKGIIIIDNKVIKKKYGVSLVDKYRKRLQMISYIVVVVMVLLAICLSLLGK